MIAAILFFVVLAASFPAVAQTGAPCPTREKPSRRSIAALCDANAKRLDGGIGAKSVRKLRSRSFPTAFLTPFTAAA